MIEPAQRGSLDSRGPGMTWPPHPPALALMALSLVALVLVVAGVSYWGFRRGARSAYDEKLAERVLRAVYAGSLRPVDRWVEPALRSSPRTDKVIGAADLLLQASCGLPRQVTRGEVARHPTAKRYGFWATTWEVSAETRSFEMLLNYDSLGMVSAIWLRFSPREPWTTVQQYGGAHLRGETPKEAVHG
jgi:hypothetical protein